MDKNKEESKKGIVDLSEDFAVRIVNVYRYLWNERRERVISNQLLRAGTSIGANVAESQCAVSKPDFISKMHIAYKECSETRYWLRLLRKTNYLNDNQFHSIYKDSNDIFSMLTVIIKNSKLNL